MIRQIINRAFHQRIKDVHHRLLKIINGSYDTSTYEFGDSVCQEFIGRFVDGFTEITLIRGNEIRFAGIQHMGCGLVGYEERGSKAPLYFVVKIYYQL